MRRKPYALDPRVRGGRILNEQHGNSSHKPWTTKLWSTAPYLKAMKDSKQDSKHRTAKHTPHNNKHHNTTANQSNDALYLHIGLYDMCVCIYVYYIHIYICTRVYTYIYMHYAYMYVCSYFTSLFNPLSEPSFSSSTLCRCHGCGSTAVAATGSDGSALAPGRGAEGFGSS